MKSKIVFISCLFFIFIIFICLSIHEKKNAKHKILDIIRADLFYVDMNDNSKIDDNELFKLKDIYVFSNELNNFSKLNAQKLKLKETDYLKIGYLLDNWVNDNLKNKEVEVTSIVEDKTKKYNYITVNLNGYDLSRFYLENGLGFAKENSSLSIYQNSIQIKNNINEVSKLNFFLLNLNTNILHKLTCEFIDKMYNAKLILAKNSKDHIPCKSCFSNINLPSIPNSGKVSFSQSFDDIELYLINPFEYNKPDNSCGNKVCKRLLDEINNAKTSIDIALYGFGDIAKIYNALKDAKTRGVKIRAVVDYSKKMDDLYSKTRDFINEFNAHTDNNEVIMHNKFFIFDNKKVLTGSANISPSGIGGYSANSVAIIKSEKLAKHYTLEFEQMYNGLFSFKKHKFDIASDGNISVYFAPKDDIKSMIISEIKSSKIEICISAFYLTNKEIINELISASKRGVKVYIILDAVSANNFKDRVKLMRQNNIALIVENWGGKDHEKTMLIDNNTLIIGSLNFTNAGLNKNDENIIRVKNSDIAEFYRKYFFYLFNSIDKKYLKLIPRAEGYESINSCFDGIDNNFDNKIDKEDEGCIKK